MTADTEQKGKITLGLITSWALGGFFLLTGALFIFSPEYGAGFAIPCLVIAVLLLPPIRKMAYQKTGKSLSTGVRVVLVIICFAVATAALPTTTISQSQNTSFAAASEGVPQEAQEVQTRKASDIPDNFKASVMERCQMDMGEHGATLVKACVDQDIKAYQALQTYSAEHAALIERCKMDMSGHGWVMVKACTDQDIKSQKALSDY